MKLDTTCQSVASPSALCQLNNTRLKDQSSNLSSEERYIDQLFLMSLAPKWLKPWPIALKEAKKIKDASLASPENLKKDPWNVQDPKTLKIVSLNIESLPANILNLRADPTVLKGDIICLQETWYHSTQEVPELTDQFHPYLHGEGQGKGVAVYIRKNWLKFLRGLPIVKSLDFAWIMKLDFKVIEVLTVYRSPDRNYSHRYPDFVRMVHSLLNPSNAKPTVICGDFNFDYYKDPQNPLRVMLEKRGFTQIVTKPTTIHGNCIDHVYVRGIDPTHHIYYPYYSNHEAICVMVKKKATKN